MLGLVVEIPILFLIRLSIITDKSAEQDFAEQSKFLIFFVVVVAYFILSRLLYLAYSANLRLLCMPHPGMGPLV